MSCYRQHSAVNPLHIHPLVRCISQSRSLRRRRDRQERRAVRLYRRGVVIVVNQQAVVDIAVAFIRAGTLPSLLLFCEGVCES